MPFEQLKRNYDKLRRSREIAAVFLKYRLGSLFSSRFTTYFVLENLTKTEAIEKLSLAERFRMALEELGPVFIKFGQMLSIRPDLVPKEFVEELSLLQDKSWGTAVSDIAPVLAREWGDRAYGKFKVFNQKPFAVASLSQVHEAVLISGERVAVKIQKPGIEETIKLDLEVLTEVVKYWERRSATGWIYQPEIMLDEFSRVIWREVDFLQEARNYERFRQNLRGFEGVKIPKVFWELTTSRVLTTEYIEGVKINEVNQPENRLRFNPQIVVKRGVDLILKQIFEDGFFHADTHPANIYVMPGNIIAMLDVGMVSWLDEKNMLAASRLFKGFMRKNISDIMRAFEELGMKKEHVDAGDLSLDLREFISKYHGLNLEHLCLGDMGSDLLEILVRHRMVIPRNLVFVIKTFATVESIGQKLDKNFNIFDHAQVFFQRLIVKKFSPAEIWEKTKTAFQEIFDIIEVIPQEIFGIFEKLREGKIKLIFEHRGLETLVHVLDRSASRVSFSIIIASFMLSWALIIKSRGIADFLGIIGIIGLAVAIVWAAILIISIIRSRKY